MAIRMGASAIGLVSSMPSGPGVIPTDLIPLIAAHIPPAIGTFLLTSQTSALAVVALQRYCRTNTVQLCDKLTTGSYADLRAGMPGISIVQVIHVQGEEAVAEALSAAPHVDALLLDSGRPGLPVKELGGTGRQHDWAISRRIRETVDIPLFLAGGLNASNIRRAIGEVGPFGVDVCSGVRTDGRLDEQKLSAFFGAIEHL